MAIVKFPPGSPGINKSFQGATFSANFSGSIIRTHKKGLVYNSDRSTFRRVKFRHLCQFWRTMTPSQKQDWTDERLNFPRTNSLGQTYYLNGFQFFCSYNQIRLNQGLEILKIPPEVITWPSSVITEVNIDIDPIDIDVYVSDLPVPDEFEYRLWATRVCSEGLFYKWPDQFKLVTTWPEGYTTPRSIRTPWIHIFGEGPPNIIGVKKEFTVFVALEMYNLEFNISLFVNQFKASIVT